MNQPMLCLFTNLLLQAVINILALLSHPELFILLSSSFSWFLGWQIFTDPFHHCLRCSFCFVFCSSVLSFSSYSSRMSAVTQGVLTGRCLPSILLAAMLKLSVNILLLLSIPESRKENVQTSPCLCLKDIRKHMVVRLFKIKSDPGVTLLILMLTFFRCNLIFIMTNSWSLPSYGTIKRR